jgi:hypothetical protein
MTEVSPSLLASDLSRLRDSILAVEDADDYPSSLRSGTFLDERVDDDR